MTVFNKYRSLGRKFDTTDTFPTVPPIVSFTGLVIGPGRTLLDAEVVPGLGDIQLKCCGFIQLSTYLAPGNPTKTPFKGFHPFQVFVIFPIHAIPWSSLCKRMVERQETHFQPNTLFSCTGKVVGFLDHRVMIHPPQRQDYVFTVVPDTWYFHDRTGRDSISTLPAVTTPAKQPSVNDVGRAKFMSPLITTSSHIEPTSVTPSC